MQTNVNCKGIVIENIFTETDFKLLSAYVFLRSYSPSSNEITENWAVIEGEILRRMKGNSLEV